MPPSGAMLDGDRVNTLEKTVAITTLWEIDTAIRDGDVETVVALADKVSAIATGDWDWATGTRRVD